MVLFQIMASVACLDSAGIPEGKTDIRHQPGAHAAPVTQPHIGAYAGDAGNPCKLADAAVMVNRPCAGHHGNEGSPLQPIAHLVDIGKAGPFQLKRPIAGSFPFKLDKGQERIIPKLRITADADSIAEPVVQGACQKNMASQENIMARPCIEIRGNLGRHTENQARLPRDGIGGVHIQPNRVQPVHIHLIRSFSIKPAQTQGRRRRKIPGTAGHPAQIQIRHPILDIHASAPVSGIHGAKQFKIGLRGENRPGGGFPAGAGALS